MAKILGREGTNTQVSGMFFKAMMQAVLLFGSYMWVLNYHTGRVLESFQHRVDRLITGRQPKRR